MLTVLDSRSVSWMVYVSGQVETRLRDLWSVWYAFVTLMAI